MKRLSNKYGKNSKNNKFNEILHLEREKVKKGFEGFVRKLRKNRKTLNPRPSTLDKKIDSVAACGRRNEAPRRTQEKTSGTEGIVVLRTD